MRRSPKRSWALLWSLLLVLAGAGGTIGLPATLVAEPGWPPSAGLLVSEVATGGATASDEFVELYNAAAVPMDLNGLELVYVTATGSMVTRKASWATASPVGPGRHVLLANASGVHAALADATYSGGFAATGGALVLRAVGGAVVDSLAWGDAANAFVEGTAGLAPPAGSSLERLPGGSAGNARDTNDNGADTHIEPAPTPHNLAAPGTPSPLPTPTAGPTVTPGTTPTPGATATSSGSASDPPTAAPTSQPTLEPTTEPTLQPTLEPTASVPPTPSAAPSAAPTASPTESPPPTASPTRAIDSILSARAAPPGTTVLIEGALTTPLGLVEGGHGAFLQDASAGIGLYTAGTDWPAAPVGTLVRVLGTVDVRYGQTIVRVASPADVAVLGPAVALPDPVPVATGLAGEELEGLLIAVEGTVQGSPDAVADGFAVDVDDGTGSLRVVVAVATGISPDVLARGTGARLVGVLGQRDSSGTGTAGYRLYLRSPADVTPLASPSPSPSPTPGPSASGSPSVSPSPTASPTSTPAAPSPTPTQTPSVPIAIARALPLDARVSVRGTVVAEPGLLLDDRTFFITDASGGIAVRLEGEHRTLRLERGRSVTASGRIGQRYGNLELRIDAIGGVGLGGVVPAPAPVDLPLSALGEATEGRFARVAGEIADVDANTSGSVSIVLRDGSAEGRVFLFPAFGADAAAFDRGARIRAVGVVGQRASGTGRADGYRLWPRDAADLEVIAASDPAPAAPDPSSPPDGTSTQPRVSIAQALREGGGVTVEGIVSSPPGLLDGDGRRVTIQDASAAVLVRLPPDARVAAGTRLRASGEIGTYFGAPQLAADEVRAVGSGSVAVVPHARGELPAALEWRLVRIEGEVVDVRRSGGDWRADVRIDGGADILVTVTERSSIAATALPEGSRAAIVGIVRRPYPTASDRRYSLMPRSVSDLGVVRAPAAADPTGEADASGGAASTTGGGGGGVAGAPRAAGPIDDPGDAPIDVSLDELPGFAGRLVRVGGEVADRGVHALALDDGIGTAVARFPPHARDTVALVERGDVVNVVGRVERAGHAWDVVAADAAGLSRVGALTVPADAVGSSASVPVEAAAPRVPLSEHARPAMAGVPSVGAVVLVLVVMGTLVGGGGLAAVVAARRRTARFAARLRVLGLDVPPGGRPAPPET